MKRTKIQNKNLKTVNLKNIRIYILSSICGILAVTSIFMTIESASSGTEVANIQKQEATLLVQRQDLQTALVQNLSVNSLQEKSNGMGFTKISNLVYVANSGNVSAEVSVARLP